MRRRACSERGLMSEGNGFGKLDKPEVYSPFGVISLPSGPTAFRMSIVADSDAIAIQTLRMPRKRPGHTLRRVSKLYPLTAAARAKRTDDQNRKMRAGTAQARHEAREGSVRV